MFLNSLYNVRCYTYIKGCFILICHDIYPAIFHDIKELVISEKLLSINTLFIQRNHCFLTIVFANYYFVITVMRFLSRLMRDRNDTSNDNPQLLRMINLFSCFVDLSFVERHMLCLLLGIHLHLIRIMRRIFSCRSPIYI